MKANSQKTVWSLVMVLLFTFISLTSFSQGKMTKMCMQTPAEAKSKISSLLTVDAGMVTLNKDLSARGFKKINFEGAYYCFTGTYFDSTSKTSNAVEFYAADYYNSSTNQMASIVYRKVGSNIYKANLVLPAGEKDMGKALDESVEFFVDASGKLVKASSWGRCFRRCIFKKAAPFCLASAGVCAAAAVTLGLVTAGAATGPAVAFFFQCMGPLCGVAAAVCAVGCI